MIPSKPLRNFPHKYTILKTYSIFLIKAQKIKFLSLFKKTFYFLILSFGIFVL